MNQAAFDALGMRDYIWRYPRGSYIQERWFDLGNPGLLLSSSSWTIQSPPPQADFAPQTSVGSVDLGSRRGGTPSLLKDQTLGPALAKVVQPVSDGMRLSLSKASATRVGDHPWANNHSPCHRSRSRGVGARYILSRKSPTSSCHRSWSCTMSVIPSTTANRLLLQNIATPLRVRFM